MYPWQKGNLEVLNSLYCNINFCSVVRSWTCICRLPRSHCPDACQFYVGFPVLFHASYSWVGQSGNEQSYAVIDLNIREFKIHVYAKRQA